MDYKETQEQELEALEAIYQEEEFEIENNEYPNISIRFHLSSCQHEDDETDNDFDVSLLIELPENYPDVIPSITLEDDEELFPEERIAEVVKVLEKEAEENVGMVMVYSIVSAMQDQMGELLNDRKKVAEEKADGEREKIEAIARKKFEGTIVTPESFKAWKAKFDAERRSQVEKQEREREALLAGRLTGRELFLKDATLNMSDVALIELSVEVDESLFDAEELEGLDLEDSDED